MTALDSVASNSLSQKTIFIQIASYRDPQLRLTIENALQEAEYPDRLIFGICRQFCETDGFDSLDDFVKARPSQFRIVHVPYKESLGACWARNQLQQTYDNEDYTLQIDSHMRFASHWDTDLIAMLQGLQAKGIAKPILTAYTSSFDPDNDPDGRVRVPWQMNFDKFTPEGCVFFLPGELTGWTTRDEPLRARFYSAHFAFTIGLFVREVPHDPTYYFHGEEISIAVRAYTHGYDLFHPHKIFLWHEYTRKGRVKQWDDDRDWYRKNDACHAKNRELLCVDMDPLKYRTSHRPYHLGSVRTLRQYERFAGLCFGNRQVHPDTLAMKEPQEGLYNHYTDAQWLQSFSGPGGKVQAGAFAVPVVGTVDLTSYYSTDLLIAAAVIGTAIAAIVTYVQMTHNPVESRTATLATIVLGFVAVGLYVLRTSISLYNVRLWSWSGLITIVFPLVLAILASVAYPQETEHHNTSYINHVKYGFVVLGAVALAALVAQWFVVGNVDTRLYLPF